MNLTSKLTRLPEGRVNSPVVPGGEKGCPHVVDQVNNFHLQQSRQRLILGKIKDEARTVKVSDRRRLAQKVAIHRQKSYLG